MSAFTNVGSVAYGSLTITIVGSGTTFTCNNFTVDRGSNEVYRNDENGEPNGLVGIHTPVKGTCEIEFPTTTTPSPILGATFIKTLETQYGAETFSIMSIGKTENSGATKKCNIGFSLTARNAAVALY